MKGWVGLEHVNHARTANQGAKEEGVAATVCADIRDLGPGWNEVLDESKFEIATEEELAIPERVGVELWISAFG